MKAGVFASPNRNLIYVRKDQTVACTTLYPSTWPGMKVRYSEKRDEVELCGYVFVRVADVPNGCTKPHLHLQDVAANLRVPYVHRDENGEPLKLQPFVAATIDAPYMKVNHHQFNEGPSFPSNGFVHGKTVTGRSVIAADPPQQNITRAFKPAYAALASAADKAAESMHSFVEAACGETREESEASWAAVAEMGLTPHAGGILSSTGEVEPFGVSRSEHLLPIDEVKHFEQGASIGAQLAECFSEEIEIRVLAQQELIGDGTATEFRIKPFPIHGRPLHPQMKKVGITGLVVDPEKPEQMKAVKDLFEGRIALCSAKSARKHRKQGHHVWFHPLFKAYAWSKENVA
jgi:hypothetical protein